MHLEDSTLVIPLQDHISLTHQQVMFGKTDLTLTDAFLHETIPLIEIGPVVIEIRGAKNGELAVPVNDTLVSHMAFLAPDTQLCVLIQFTWMSTHCKFPMCINGMNTHDPELYTGVTAHSQFDSVQVL